MLFFLNFVIIIVIKGGIMQRYFAKAKEGDNLILYDSDYHHIKDVMRYQVNDKIEVIYDDVTHICVINSINPLSLSIIDTIKEDREMTTKLTIAISLVNEQKMDLILQKLTELGVDRIIPVKTQRSVVKLDDKKIDKKLARWQMICKEASEQSKRTNVPKVENIMNLTELLTVPNDLKLICSLNAETKPLNYYLKENIKDVLFVIGPEGGFTDDEEKLLQKDFKPVSLGKRVMRVETAAIYVASIINYICEG